MLFDIKFFFAPVHQKSYFSTEVKFFFERNIKILFRVLIAEILSKKNKIG